MLLSYYIGDDFTEFTDLQNLCGTRDVTCDM